MPKDLAVMPRLFDLYGGLLTDRQRELFTLSYHHDLTLAEIAEEAGITRQAARDAVARTEDALRGYEDALGFYKRTVTMQDAINDAIKALSRAAIALLGADEPLGATSAPTGEDHGI